MASYTLTIDGWHPARLNQWDGRHWAVRARLKRADREIVAMYSRMVGIPSARGQRRVSLTLMLGPRQRGADPDAYWKSTLDALVHASLLLDDSRQYVQLGSVAYQRGKIKATEIILEDTEHEPQTAGKGSERMGAPLAALEASDINCHNAALESVPHPA